MTQTKHLGGAQLPLVECINSRIGRCAVRWGYEPADEGGISYMEQVIDHRPTLHEVKDIVLAAMNADIDTQIATGFTWAPADSNMTPMPVWLSTENQFNYKAAFDLAIQTGGQNLPQTFKFGTTQQPVYYTFTTVADLQDFYTRAMAYINGVLADGWKRKDAVDWTQYEVLLNTVE